MKKIAILLNFLMMMIVAFTISGCRRNGDQVWDDTKTASRHVNRGVRSLAGKHGDSRAVRSREDFYPYQDAYAANASQGGDYIPLPDAQNPNDIAMGDFIAPQPRETPGDPGSSIPGIDQFRDPSTSPELARVFRNILFEYNSNLIKGQDNLDTLSAVANYMRNNPNTYIYVEGHTDERGPEAYNLALGARRSDAVRNQLISDGVNPDHVFSTTYGRERPLVMEHHEEAWSVNRRAEFKIYQR